MLSVMNKKDIMSSLHSGKNHSHGKGISVHVAPPTATEVVAMFRKKDKLAVLEMRQYIRILVAELFFDHKYSPNAKCRGIWKEKPSDWPTDVPFLDPNNPENPEISKQKPSKSTLALMTLKLVALFEERRRNNKGSMSCAIQSSDWRQQQQEEESSDQVYINPGVDSMKMSLSKEISADLSIFSTLKIGDFTKCEDEDLMDTLDFIAEDRTVYLEEVVDRRNYINNTEDLLQYEYAEPNAVTIEGSDIPQDVMEEGGNFDLVGYVDEDGTPIQVNLQYEEIGSDINFNVQLQSDETGVMKIKAPTQDPFPAIPMMPPPPSNAVQGMPTSNAGEIVMSHSAAPVSYENEAPEETIPWADFNLDNLDIADLINDDNLVLDYEIQQGPVEEANSAATQQTSNQSIPTTVLEFDEM